MQFVKSTPFIFKFYNILLSIVMLVGTLKCSWAYPTELSPELSFKTLESGESSGEIANQCCQRESKYITVGYGISEGEVRIDVGQCRQKCVIPIVKPLKRDEFDKYLRRHPDMDPIQIFLSLQTKTSLRSDSVVSEEVEDDNHYQHPNYDENSHSVTASCLQSVCLPASVKREIYYDLSGVVKDFDVIESCECVSLPQEGCQRISSMVKINVDSPYERQLDVGRCLGSCDDDSAEHCLSCRPVRNRTVSVEGPNGAQCLNVIDECQCVGNCYRVRQFLKIYDYTHVFEATLSNDVNGTVIRTATNSSINGIPRTMNGSATEPLTKVIDIGRCSGSCSDVPLASKCLVWSTTNNGTCLSALTGGRSKCTATKFVSHSYMDKYGKRHTVVSVTGCGCR